ncbi:MAG: BMC domain-containing protein [Clostridiales bacterium]|jgi:microcompartment protein CcmL/EutN|nr:BMC domain-containing protein [Clostridiales bacterium]
MALGLIEVFGFTTAIIAADAAAKAAAVEIAAMDINKPAAGDAAEVPLIVQVKIQGGVSEVEHAVLAGVEAAKRMNQFVASHVISREADGSAAMARISDIGKDKLRKIRSDEVQ